jgi:hypothetical protein
VDLQVVVEDLCRAIPSALGAIVCDYEGESVVHALGQAPLSPSAERNARSLIPRALQPTMSIEEFFLKLAGAEPCALLRMLEEPSRGHGFGGLVSLEMRYQGMDLLVRRLPDEYYVVLLLRPPALVSSAHDKLERASQVLARMIS